MRHRQLSATLLLLLLTALMVGRSLQQACTGALDVGFMITHSGSVTDRGSDNYAGYLLPFVRDVAAKLNPSFDGTHIGVVGFASNATTIWNLTAYASNSADLLANINANMIPNDGGNTNLAAALQETRLNVMSPSGGDRPAVPNVCVLITASVSTVNASQFIPEANLTKTNCKLIIIAVAADPRSTPVLQPAVSNQTTDYIFIANFSLLSSYENQLVNLLCSVALTTTTAATTTTTTTATTPTTTVTMTTVTMTTLPPSSASSSASVPSPTTPSSSATPTTPPSTDTESTVSSTSSSSSLSSSLATPSSPVSATTTSSLQPSSSTAATNVTLPSTDTGSITPSTSTTSAAVMPTGSSTATITPSPASATTTSTTSSLQPTASSSAAATTVTLPSFAQSTPTATTSSTVMPTGSSTATATPSTASATTVSTPATLSSNSSSSNNSTSATTQPPSPGSCGLDVGFMIPHSGSVTDQGKVNYAGYLLPFVRDVAAKLNPSFDGTHIGVVGYASIATTAWNLAKYAANAVDLLASITEDQIPNDGGNTNLTAALSEMLLNVMSASGGDRSAVPNVCVLITAGMSSDSQFLAEANITKNTCKLIIIGVGNATADPQFKAALLPAVSNPDTDYFSASNFSSLSDIENQLVNDMCGNATTSTLTGSSAATTSTTSSSTSTVSPATATTTTATATGATPTVVTTSPTATTTAISGSTSTSGTTLSTPTAFITSLATPTSPESTTTSQTTIPTTVSPTTTTTIAAQPTTTTATATSTTTTLTTVPATTTSTTASTTTTTTPPPTTTTTTTPTTTTTTTASTTTKTTTTASTTTRTTLPPTSTTTLPPPVGCLNQVDVVFVVDSSGSIDVFNFDNIVSFVSTLVTSFDVDSGSVRVGLVTFSDTVYPAFNLSQYSTRTAIKTAVSSLTFKRGTTNTAAAIRYIRTVMFTAEAGGRPSVPDVIVLLTDGGSDDTAATLNEAFLAKKASIELVVVGIGSWLDVYELDNIASYPYTATVVVVTNTSTLYNYTQPVLDLVCNNTNECASNPCRVGTCVDRIKLYTCQCPSLAAGRNCERVTVSSTRQIDLIVAFDGASRVGEQNFQLELDIGRELVYGINLVDNRFAAMSYSDRPHVQFNLNTFTNQFDILTGLSMPYPGGGTNLSAAIASIRNDMFSSAAGARSNSTRVAVIFVDGQSIDESASVGEARLARQAGITLIVVGIGTQLLPEWLGVASFPASFNVFSVANYSMLPTIVSRLISTVANDQNDCLSLPCRSGGTCVDLISGYQCICTGNYTGTNCERASSGVIDLFITLDTSGSMRRDRFQSVLNFIQTFVNGLEVRPDKTQVALVTFSNTSQVLFDLNTYTAVQDVAYQISQTPYFGGLTNLSGGLATVSSRMTSAYGDRQNALNVLLLVTDGNANIDGQSTVGNAISLRQRGTLIIVVSIGNDANTYGLMSLATDPTNQTIIYAYSYTALQPGLYGPIYSLMGTNSQVCSTSSVCQNGGQCLPNFVWSTCQCTVDWTGQQCQRHCVVSLDVAVVLDMSSADSSLIYSVSVPFIRQLVYGLPIQADRTRVSLITAADTPVVQFYLNTYSDSADLRQALSVWPAVGRPCLPATLQSLNGTVFVASRGARRGPGVSPSVPSVVVIVTDADTPFDYSTWTTAGTAALSAGFNVYAVGVGDGPDRAALTAIAGGVGDHVFSVGGANDVTTAANRLLDKLCQ